MFRLTVSSYLAYTSLGLALYRQAFFNSTDNLASAHLLVFAGVC